MKTRQRNETKRNKTAKQNKTKRNETKRNDVTQSKGIRKRMREASMKESSTRLTRKKAKEVETQINLISDRELRLLRRHNNISNTSTSPSVNDPSTTVEKDPKVPLDDGSTETSVSTEHSVVKSPPIRKDESVALRKHPRIASKAAMKSIGKIARFERKSTRKCSSNTTQNEDEISTFHLCLEDSENESSNSFDQMLNESLKTSQIKDTPEKSMEIIVPKLPQIHAKVLRLPPRSTTDEDTSTGISRNTSIGSFRSVFGTDTDPNLDQSTDKKIKKLSDVLKYFSVPKTIKKSIASEEDRRTNHKIMYTNIRGWLSMVNLAQTCTNQIIEAICPGPSRSQLRHTIGQRLSNENITASQRKAKTINEQFDHLISTLFKVMNASKRGSIPKKVARAILCAGIPKTSTLRFLCEKNKSSYISTGTTRMEALVDYETIVAGNFTDEKKKNSRKRKDDEAVDDLVKFLLSPDNVRTYSWGTVVKELSEHESIVLPKLQRTTTRTNLWLRYQQHIMQKINNNSLDHGRIGRSNFFNIVKQITYSEEVLLGSVDYVQALLMSDPVELLESVIEKYFTGNLQKQLSSNLYSVSQFLKYTYNKHMTLEDECCTHGIDYSLGRKDSTYDENSESKVSVTCVACRFPTYVCHKIQTQLIEHVSDNSEMMQDAVTVTNDCATKFRLYMAHRVRCKNQSIAIDKIKQEMIDTIKASNGSNVHALMIIDFKMKFEPLSSRETSLDHYGKRGISWHGVHLMYFKLEEVEDDDGNITKQAVQYSVYMDQILADGNRQDSVCVASLLDAALKQISIDLPFISEITLQSDNANSYQNTFLICVIALLNSCYQGVLRIKTFIHTETQDGKTVLDAHFARCMRFLSHFMKTWKRNKITRINTANGLGFALAWNGGMKNVMVQVIRTDRTQMNNIQQVFEPIIKKMKQFFTRVNHINFISETSIDNKLELINQFNFKIGIQSYSNIGRVSTFEVDLAEATVTPDEYVQQEINFNLNGYQASVEPNDFEDNGVELDNEASDCHNSTNNSPTNQTSAEVLDFTVERQMKDDDRSPNDANISDEYSSDTSSDDESNLATGMNTNAVDNRFYTVPDSTIFSVDAMITKTEISKILHLGSARQRKLLQESNGKKSKKKKVTFEFNNDRNDVITRSIRFANDHIIGGGLIVKDAHMTDASLSQAEEFELDSTHYQRGWARRTKVEGSLYGKSYISNYLDDIEELFQRGKQNSSDKMNPAQMRDALIAKYPNRFTIPSETEIKQEIGRLFSQFKNTRATSRRKNNRGSVQEGFILDRNTNNVIVNWETVLEDLVSKKVVEKPEAIYKQFLSIMTETYSIPLDDVPAKGNVKKKITAFKQKYKKEAITSVI